MNRILEATKRIIEEHPQFRRMFLAELDLDDESFDILSRSVEGLPWRDLNSRERQIVKNLKSRGLGLVALQDYKSLGKIVFVTNKGQGVLHQEKNRRSRKITASNFGVRIFRLLVDQNKLYAAKKVADEQTSELIRLITLTMMAQLEPKNARMEQAINRLNNAIANPTNAENLRNQIFKVADELGMRLSNSMF